tara:strand:- start:5895 stop:6965 length:1071 start_codon:yes stop_codon:yes gene_type:complete
MSDYEPNITVIVTVRNRRNTLPRVMNYYSDFPAKVIFLDSTQGFPYNDHAAAPNEYRHVPGKKYTQKIRECLETIDTEYCVVVCDDDFLVRGSLDKCITFLDDNDDYVGCRGQEVALLDDFLSLETIDYLVDQKKPFSSKIAKDRVSRMWSVFNGANVHNIIRTDVYKKILDFHKEHTQFDAINIYDKTFSFVLAALGNVAVLPLFYIVRSNETRATSLKLSEDVEEEIGDWKPEIKFKEHFLLCDTEPLEELSKCDRGFIEELYTNLCTNKTKDRHLLDVLENNNLGLPFDYVPIIDGYPLTFRFGPGGDLFGQEGWRKFFTKTKEDITDLYPVYKQDNIIELYKVVSTVKEFPL